FAALYGNSSGGVISVFTQAPPSKPTLSGGLSIASHASWKWRAGYGDTVGGVGGRFDLSRFRTDGYRTHSRTLRDLAGAQIGWSGDDDTFTLNATALDQPDTQDPLGLTRAQLQENRRQPGTGALAFDTRKSVTHRQAGADWQHRL